jgi:hypothetical protein
MTKPQMEQFFCVCPKKDQGLILVSRDNAIFVTKMLAECNAADVLFVFTIIAHLRIKVTSVLSPHCPQTGTCNFRITKYRVLQKKFYNFESLYKFIQRTCTMSWTVIMFFNSLFFISNKNHFRFYKLICWLVYDMKRLIQWKVLINLLLGRLAVSLETVETEKTHTEHIQM